MCIRPAEGYCCIEYTPCTDDRSWSIDLNNAILAMIATKVDTNCITDYIGIAGIQIQVH